MNDLDADIKWLEAFKSGDKQVFKQVYEKIYRPLYVFVSGILNNDLTLAEDIVQECFQKLWNSRERMASENHVRNFLYLAARHGCINILRQRKSNSIANWPIEELLIENEHNAETARVHAEIIAELFAQIESLPPKYSRIVKMIYLEEMSTAEVAKSLGVSPNAVFILKSRALKMLRLKVLDKSLHIILVLLACLYAMD